MTPSSSPCRRRWQRARGADTQRPLPAQLGTGGPQLPKPPWSGHNQPREAARGVRCTINAAIRESRAEQSGAGPAARSAPVPLPRPQRGGGGGQPQRPAACGKGPCPPLASSVSLPALLLPLLLSESLPVPGQTGHGECLPACLAGRVMGCRCQEALPAFGGQGRE